MSDRSITFGFIMVIVGYIIVLLLILSLAGLWIYCLIVYGNTPLSECPTWVAWFLGGSGK